MSLYDSQFAYVVVRFTVLAKGLHFGHAFTILSSDTFGIDHFNIACFHGLMALHCF